MTSPSAVSVTAFIQITVEANESGNIVKRLFDDHANVVVEAAAVYGESDVIAKIETTSIDQLHKLVMDNIQRMDKVKFTRTFIVIPNLHRTK